MINQLFKKKYPEIDGIYNCLENESLNNLIKRKEMEVYSKRAELFKEEKMLNLSLAHQKALAPLLQYPKNSVFLEIGGGDGRFAFYLVKQGYQVIESDIAFGSVKKVQTIARKNNISNCYYAVIDAEILPFKNESLDAVFMVATLHHLPNPERAIAEVARILKTNGHFLILREPASWQYKIFGPIYKFMKKFLRSKNKKDFSLADDITQGFSKKKLRFLLSPYFKNIELIPVHYQAKSVDNFVILLNKIFKKNIDLNPKMKEVFQKIDKLIAKIPVIKNFPWDWDIYCQKKIN
jgi:ubiquinone/menaquinone biosynthesis C-methylase UbiE